MINKIIIKNEVREILLDFILKGKIKPGQRISLPTLAQELEISVTPIREALTQLSETGIVSYVPNRGFLVNELTIEEALEIYELMILIEGNAVEKSKFTKKQIEDLVRINLNLAQVTNSLEILKYDRCFHQKLVENYNNKTGIKIIETLRVRISMYEYAFWIDTQKADSIKMHDDIINLIKSNNILGAKEIIEQNWRISINHISKNLQTHHY